MLSRKAFLIVTILLLTMLVTACNSSDVPRQVEALPTAAVVAEGRPTIQIDQPADGTTIEPGMRVFLLSTARDATGVARTDMLVNGVTVQSDTPPELAPVPMFSLLQIWLPPGPGTYTLEVIAYRADGVASASASITVHVADEPAVTPEAQAAVLPATATAEPEVLEGCVAIATTKLVVRSGPRVRQAIVGELELGQQVIVTGRNDDTSWYQIDFEGEAGWVSSLYLYPIGECQELEVAAGSGLFSFLRGTGGANPTATPEPEPGEPTRVPPLIAIFNPPPKPAATSTSAPTATLRPIFTLAPTATLRPPSTLAPTATLRPTWTPLPTVTNTPQPTWTPLPTVTKTPQPTNTPLPTATNTPWPTVTNTPWPTATNTPWPTATEPPPPTATEPPPPTATEPPPPTATEPPPPTATEPPPTTTEPPPTTTEPPP